MIMESKLSIIALLVALVCMAAPVMAQPTPFVLDGHVFAANDDPCNDPSVQVTNTNTSASWDAENSSASNDYLLMMDSDNVSKDDVLRFDVTGCSQSKTTQHTVSQAEIDGGGFSKDVTLKGSAPLPQQPDLVIAQKSEAWVSREDMTYNITYTIANTGAAGANVSTTSITIDGNKVATDPVPELSAGESYMKTLGPFTMSGDDDAIKVCADRDDAVSESNEVNNCRENSFRHQIAAVPVLTPLGLAVLISLLSVFSVMNIRRRGK